MSRPEKFRDLLTKVSHLRRLNVELIGGWICQQSRNPSEVVMIHISMMSEASSSTTTCSSPFSGCSFHSHLLHLTLLISIASHSSSPEALPFPRYQEKRSKNNQKRSTAVCVIGLIHVLKSKYFIIVLKDFRARYRRNISHTQLGHA